MKKSVLSSVIWIMGFGFMIAQIVAVREFLVVFQGNELSIGIVLGNWLLLEAMGSALGGRRADRSREPVRMLASLQVAVSLLLPITVVCIRMSRDITGIPPWEVIGPIRVWITSLLLLWPLGLCLGAEFSFGCQAFSQVLAERSRAPGTVYVWEAIGSVCGGVIFTYCIVGHLHSFNTAILVGALNMISALLLIGRPGRITEMGIPSESNQAKDSQRSSRRMDRNRQALCFIIIWIAALLYFTPLADRIDHWSSKMRWKGLDLQESAESVYGNVSVFKMGGQFSFFQNGIPAITTPVPDITSVEEVVHLTLLAHENPKQVLFLGGGIGGALSEALKHPVSDIHYTELDPLLIRMVQKFPSPLTDRELGDPRTRVHYEDGRLFLLKTNLRFDAVLIYLPDATTLLVNRFLTLEFFSLIRSHLNHGGLLAITLPGSTSYLSQEILLLTQSAVTTLMHIFPATIIIPGDRNLILASRDIPLQNLTPEVLATRMTQRGIKAALMSPSYISYKMDPAKARWAHEALNRAGYARINEDFSPALLYYFLAYKNAQLHNRWRGAVLALGRVHSWHILVALSALNIAGLILFVRKKRNRSMALSLSVFTTGFAAMTIEIILILSFQTLYGYIYHWVGILVSSFMGGLALGAFLVNRRLEKLKHGFTVFVFLEILLVLSLLGIFLGLLIASRASIEGPVAFSILKTLFVLVSCMCGFIVGAEFPIANFEVITCHKGLARIAGRLYAFDLAGAWLGTTVVSVLLIPLLGIPHALLLIGASKALGLPYLLLARQR